MIEPTTLTKFPKIEGPVLIVEPHDDDAFINLATLVWAHPELKFNVLTLSTCPGVNEKLETSAWKDVLNMRTWLQDIDFTRKGRLQFLRQTRNSTKLSDYDKVPLTELLHYYNPSTPASWSQMSLVDYHANLISHCSDIRTFFFPVGLVHPMHRIAAEIGRALRVESWQRIYWYREFPYFQRVRNNPYESIRECATQTFTWPAVVDRKYKEFGKIYKSQWFIQRQLKSLLDEECLTLSS